MRVPEHMDSTDLGFDGLSDKELASAVYECMDEMASRGEFDAADFFECYIDPEGPFRYSGSFDAWGAIGDLCNSDPHMMADRLREWIKDSGPMDPRKGPNQ